MKRSTQCIYGIGTQLSVTAGLPFVAALIPGQLMLAAYLADVENGSQDRRHGFEQSRNSEWFNCGWTLQELLAPHRLAFADRKWGSSD